MKATVLNLAFAASLAAAQPHHHHGHHHNKREGSPVEKRDAATAVTYVPAYVTKYVIGGEDVTPEEAQKGIDNGLYVVVGETTPTFTPPPAPEPTTTSSKEDAIFIEQVTSSTPTTTSTPPPAPTTTSTYEAVSPSPSPSKSTGTGATGIDAEFPDGEISCDEFPSAYGALSLDYLGFSGFSGIQRCPSYNPGDSAISFIETAINGEGCTKGSFCSYACPAGYVKTQWPSSQGNTGQSIGGLYCNSKGKLELTRSESKTLCEKGVGGIQIKNKMSSGVAICRTDYPGTENMVVPLDAAAGSTVDLANVASKSYYSWDGKATTLQYYVNLAGVSTEDACRWTCASNPLACGNWAPAVIGTGKSDDGITYLSIFPNLPTSTASLDYNVEITGDVTTKCSVKNGKFYEDGVECSTGCTTGVNSGGAIITFS